MGITGASGARYAQKLLKCLVESRIHVHLVISPLGKRLLNEELNISPVTLEDLLGSSCEHATIYAHNDLGAPIASGSFRTEGMIICPCSANSLGAIASGLGDNLLLRAAQVTLKEVRRLILVYREMPMSQIDLTNALALSQAGAILCPANPGFYMNPLSVNDLVDFVVGKLLDLVEVEHELNTRWNPA